MKLTNEDKIKYFDIMIKEIKRNNESVIKDENFVDFYKYLDERIEGKKHKEGYALHLYAFGSYSPQ